MSHGAFLTGEQVPGRELVLMVGVSMGHFTFLHPTFSGNQRWCDVTRVACVPVARQR
jgi:hypothetical protein